MKDTVSNWSWPKRIAVGVAAVMFLYVGLTVLNQVRTGFQALGTLFALVAGVIGLGSCWFAFFAHGPQGRRQVFFTLIGGGALGTIGFAGGFFGPLIFNPSANQGPLLGIFITGPLGFVIGSVVGFLIAAVPTRPSQPPPLPPHYKQ